MGTRVLLPGRRLRDNVAQGSANRATEHARGDLGEDKSMFIGKGESEMRIGLVVPAFLQRGLLFALFAGAGSAWAGDFAVFNDAAHFSSVLLQQGRVQTDADWNEAGDIQQGDPWGIFRFAPDPYMTALAGTMGIVSGLEVGSTDGPLGGDQGVTLKVSPGLAVTAFGVIISFEDSALLDDFRLVVDCANPPCIFAPQSANVQPSGPGSFFFGIIADDAFDTVTLEALTPRDAAGQPTGVVPGWQVQGISYAQIPEPGTLALLGVGLAGFAWRLKGVAVSAGNTEGRQRSCG